MSRRNAVRTALTDPSAIAWPLPLVVGVVLAADQVLGLGALGIVPRRDLPLAPRLAVVLGAVVVLVAILGVGRLTWLRTAVARRRPAVAVTTVIVGAQVGLTVSRRALTAVGVDAADRAAGSDEVLLVAAVTLTALAALGALARHRAAMADLSRAGARLRAAHASGDEELRTERQLLRERVRTLLEERLGPTSLRPSPYTPDGLRDLADQVLRPLSHELARTTTGFEPRSPAPSGATRWSEVVRGLRAEPVIRPRLLALAMLVLTFRLTVTAGPPTASPADPAVSSGAGVAITVDWTSLLEALLLHAAVLVVVLAGARSLARHLATRTTAATLTARWSVVTVALSTLGLGALGLLRAVHRLPGFGTLPPVDARVAVGFATPLVLITVVISLLEAATSALDGIRDEVARANDEVAAAVARVTGLLLHERRSFARHLHASVQAAVNAAGILIERATVDGRTDPAAVTRAARTIDDAVVRLLATPSADGTGAGDEADDLDLRLAAVMATWEDVARVDVDVDPLTRARLGTDPVARATVCDLVAEACANAVVHGGAGRIAVVLRTPDAHSVELVVSDDGTDDDAGGAGGDEGHRAGLGTAALTAACTRWELTRTPVGTSLRAAIPVG